MNPVFIAIDTPDIDRARSLAGAVGPYAGGLKLGLEFFSRNGPSGVAEIARLGRPIFLDLKLHDIPNTVAGAIQALAPLAPAVLTVHAAGGQAMMESARAAAPPATRVVAVTVLTSLDGADLSATGIGGDSAHQVDRLAALARASGLDGIVCSGAELASARRAWSDGFFVIPGIRPAGSEAGDQKRVMSPRQARDAGASMLVIGRPVTSADDPAAALRDILATL